MNRKYIVIIFVLALILGIYFFIPRKQDIKNYPPRNATIVAFGDSLVVGYGATQDRGFVSLLAEKLGKPIINLGVSGETSSDGLSRVQDVLDRSPGTVILLFGGNDYLKKVPKAETFQNLKNIISRLQSRGVMVVLLGVRGGILSDHYEDEYAKLAQETGAVYVSDVLDGLFAHKEYMSDEVHPNDAGYAIIADRVFRAIKGYIQ